MGPACPICGRVPNDRLVSPFCSERCREVDLGRWLHGAYRLAGEPAPSDPTRSDDEESP